MSFIPSFRCPDPEECEDDGQCNGYCADALILVEPAELGYTGGFTLPQRREK